MLPGVLYDLDHDFSRHQIGTQQPSHVRVENSVGERVIQKKMWEKGRRPTVLRDVRSHLGGIGTVAVATTVTVAVATTAAPDHLA